MTIGREEVLTQIKVEIDFENTEAESSFKILGCSFGENESSQGENETGLAD